MKAKGQQAIVREVAASFADCIREDETAHIDVDLARRQHAFYCQVLEELGVELIRLPGDDLFPDCCFVEDTAVVMGAQALISNMGAASRVGEEAAVRNLLAGLKTVHEMIPPATLDGGDVVIVGDKIYVGLSGRTNDAGYDTLRNLAMDQQYQVSPVPLRNILHLKSAITYIGSRNVVMAEGFFDETHFSDYERIVVPAGEAYAANCLAVGRTVLISEGHPRTKKLIERAGFRTIDMAMSEFRKAGGSLTCLSIAL